MVIWKMEVADSFCSIFDKAQCKLLNGRCVIHEKDSGATFTSLKLVNGKEEMFVLENAFYKHSHNSILAKSSTLDDSDSDGFLITEVNGKKTIVVSELKSSLDSSDLLKAYRQIVFTYIKIHMLLSLCASFQIEDFDIVGIIACKPPKDEKQKTFLKDRYLQMMNSTSDRVQPDVCLMVKLYYEKCIRTVIGQVPFLMDLKLQNELSRSPFKLYLRTPDSFDESALEVDLEKLLK